MSEVKRYQHITALCESSDRMLELYPSATQYVKASDYDALAVECERLREISDGKDESLMQMDALWRGVSAERDAALAELAALKGGRDVQLIEALRSADWSGVSIGNKALIQEAIQRLTAPPAQASAWVAVSERLPEVAQRLDKPCKIEGRYLPPLNITKQVQVFDGERVYADTIEWFDGGSPLKNITHWMPLAAAAPTPGASDGKGGE